MLQRLFNRTIRHGHFSTSSLGEMLQKPQQHHNRKTLKLHPLNLFYENTYILPSIIKSCIPHSYHLVLQLHSFAIKSGSDSDPVVSNSFLTAYSKLSGFNDAYKVFGTMSVRDDVSWNAMVNCFLQNGCFERAVSVLKGMISCGVAVKPELLGSVVSQGNVRLGRAVHGWWVVDGGGSEGSVVLGTALVDLYMSCGDVVSGRRVFERIEVKNEVAWTVMVSGCVGNGEYDLAIEFFRVMQVEGVQPNRVTLLTVLPAFAELGWCLDCVKEIHGYAIRRVFNCDRRFNTTLVSTYCKFRESVDKAKLIFEKMEVKDIVIWSSIIGGYCSVGDGFKGMKLFSQMREEGIQPNDVTLLGVVSCCATHCLLDLGCSVHGYALKSGLMLYVSVGNSVINMYSKCGCLPSSCQIFKEMSLKDSISWSSLISCYGLHGRGFEALEVFHEMQKEGIEPDSITSLALLSACNHAGLVEEGQRIFGEAIKDKKLEPSMEHYACYVDLLGRSGKLEDAFEIVRTMPMKPSAKIWSSLVSACKAQKKFDVARILAPCLIKSEPENAANYTLLSMIYAESGNWFDVKEVRRFMRAQKMGKCHGFSRI